MTKLTDDQSHSAARQLERLIFFSDAIFAIAITLLVLDLKLPADSHGVIAWSQIGAKLFAFALSFFVIGLYWLNHHQLFGVLRREDSLLRWVNLVFLGTIVFLPFPTSTIAEFPATTSTVPLYAASAAATGVMFGLLALVARREGLMAPGETRGRTLRAFASSLGAPTIFAVSAIVGAFEPRVAVQLFWLIAPATWIAHRVGEWLERRWDARHRVSGDEAGQGEG